MQTVCRHFKMQSVFGILLIEMCSCVFSDQLYQTIFKGTVSLKLSSTGLCGFTQRVVTELDLHGRVDSKAIRMRGRSRSALLISQLILS